MSFLKRIKRIRELSRYSDDDLDLTQAILDSSDEVVLTQGGRVIAKQKREPTKAIGVFLQDMTETEEMEWERDNTLGWAKFKRQVEEVLKPKK